MSTYSYAPINIIVQNGAGVSDDLLRILPSEDVDFYEISYKQRTINQHITHRVSVSTIIDYLESFFTALSRDVAGPEYVQIECPTFPTILLNPRDLVSYIPTLTQQIVLLEPDWPFERTYGPKLYKA
jgi:hypothetical protein